MASSNEGRSHLPSWAGTPGKGTGEHDSGSGHRGSGSRTDRHTSAVASQDYPSLYRFYVRAYSATFASGFAVYGIVELLTRK